MSFKSRLHVLSDQIEGEAPVVWRRDWLPLLALTLVTLLTGPWSVLALWTQRWNVRDLWDAKDHWEGTKRFAVTFVLFDILLIVAVMRFRPAPFTFTKAWLFWWLWWLLLTPAFTMIAEHIDPRTEKIRRVLLPRERPPVAQVGVTGKKKKTARKKGKGRHVPLGELLIEEKAEMERRRIQINFTQPHSEAMETQAAEPASPAPGTLWLLPDARVTPTEAPASKTPPEPEKPESLDDLF
jgi:hypothetical protein